MCVSVSVCLPLSNNDLENIPMGLLVMWASILCIAITQTGDAQYGHSIAHIVLAVMFTFARVSHTVTYALKLTSARTLSWTVGVLGVLAMSVNAAVAAFQCAAC